MCEKPKEPDTTVDSPYPLRGFEADLIHELEELVADLPAGTAHLRLSRVPGHPEWLEPCFAVVPMNPRAAPFKGVVVITDLNLTIGEAAWHEFIGFARGGTLVRGATWQDEFRWIWLAVVRGGFTEHIYRDSKGKAIGWATKLSVNGKDLIIRNGRRTERLFGRKNLEMINYEPYLTTR
jgi:hypothetical protein